MFRKGPEVSRTKKLRMIWQNTDYLSLSPSSAQQTHNKQTANTIGRRFPSVAQAKLHKRERKQHRRRWTKSPSQESPKIRWCLAPMSLNRTWCLSRPLWWWVKKSAGEKSIYDIANRKLKAKALNENLQKLFFFNFFLKLLTIRIKSSIR